MTSKKDLRITLSVPVETARILYILLEYAPVVDEALTRKQIMKFSNAQKQSLVELYDDLGFKLSMELWD
jgi:hypothetical protein